MTVKKTVLLVVTTTFPRWKNDTDPPFVYELSKRLVGDFDVHVHAPHYPGAETRENFSGCQVHRFRYFLSRFERIAGGSAILPFLRKNKLYYLVLPFLLLAQFFTLIKLVRKIRPDVLHAHWIVPNGLLAVLVAGKISVVVTGHGADIFGMRSQLFVFFKKMVLKRVKGITVVSKALKKEVENIADRSCPVAIIPMGVDSTKFYQQTNNKKPKRALEARLLFVGRLSEKKGVVYLLDALVKVVQEYPNTQLSVVGDGEEKDKLVEHVATLGLDKNVTFHGAVANKELVHFYNQADIFVSPAIVAKGGDTEGFGLTFIEASLCGCFLIGSMVGGVTDIITHRKTGLLVEAESSDDLAKKICWVIENPEKSRSIKRTAVQEHKSKYSWEVIAQEYKKLLLATSKS